MEICGTETTVPSLLKNGLLQRQPHINPRLGVRALTESSSAPTQHEALRATPPFGQYDSYYYGTFTNHVIFTQAPPYLASTPFASMLFAPPVRTETFEITDKAPPSISTIVSSTCSSISVACKHANASTANGEVAGFVPVHIAQKSTTKDSPKTIPKHMLHYFDTIRTSKAFWRSD
ncbi:hypothetical protein Godav_000974 [Gossypium davidsonii]|uniref:Uncharacterized protein n=1 Tax=Gossypium davidsonii TaxID=34287 RepID=A0A7J8T2A0_GOSDV|nr:hypothetical protein [Gossypium davidsonii]